MRSSSGCNGLRPLRIDRVLVHAARVVIADLLLIGGMLRAFHGDFFEQVVQNVLGIVVDNENDAVPRPVGEEWDRAC